MVLRPDEVPFPAAVAAQIQAMFKDLTGRDLDPRTRPAPEDGGEPGLITEPGSWGLAFAWGAL